MLLIVEPVRAIDRQRNQNGVAEPRSKLHYEPISKYPNIGGFRGLPQPLPPTLHRFTQQRPEHPMWVARSLR
ncbi:MAG: hypothetical protein F6K28_55315 [Microcoleus sp. SIO2G3]|nr:hypothetical protein [Microcoleus sp. SIO2G3]